MSAAGASNVSFYYPVVAQKSYGSEKRFLCPPPIVSVSGPRKVLATLTASIVAGEGEPSLDQQVTLDETGKGYFKFLHVTSTARCKAFQIQVRPADEGQATAPVLCSRPISVVSKPSKKTLKCARSDNFSLVSGSLISLYNRVNSQTVRTKFLGTEKGQFTAKNSSWTPFTIDVVQDGRVIEASGTASPIPIHYGQEVVLRDPETGFCSEVLVLKRVEKNTVSDTPSIPVAHLQKVVLQPKSKQECVYLGVSQTSAYGPTDPSLVYQSFQKSAEISVDDLVCWTIVGIEKVSSQQ